jgi:hypothetical protein
VTDLKETTKKEEAANLYEVIREEQIDAGTKE